jgi:hypothetical protein
MNNAKLTKSFLASFKAIKNGDSSAVNDIMKLWSRDGIFQFDGVPELNGGFQGTMALDVLFSSIARSAKEGNEARGLKKLKSNKLEFGEIRCVDDECYCDWKQVISDKKGRGALINGSIKLTIRKGTVVAAKVVAVPALDATDDMLPKGLSMKDLKVDDIGRLALAAWAVV